ncbi:nucleoside/nucleotide kinase family protein [Pengzhenrongella sp.]|uniref:nucleoside/nucleotide kinase family protein n=1 Tax=Pengzhenrongella sp. TaxID=2888820 RepID=UPI002F92F2D1
MSALTDLADRARGLVRDGRRAVLGVTGPPGAGKTTLVEQLLAELAPTPPSGARAGEWVAHVPMDGFHLADVQLERLGRRDRKGAPDTFDAAGYVAMLRRLREDADDVVYVPGFERELEQPIAAAIAVPRAARLILTEGNYLLLDDGDWRRVRPEVDEVWYADLDEETRLERLVSRHVRFGKRPTHAAAWVDAVDEPNAATVIATRPRADLIINTATLPTCQTERDL